MYNLNNLNELDRANLHAAYQFQDISREEYLRLLSELNARIEREYNESLPQFLKRQAS